MRILLSVILLAGMVFTSTLSTSQQTTPDSTSVDTTVVVPIKEKEKVQQKQKLLDDGRCNATTLKGTRCKRKIMSCYYCWQHK